MDREYSSVPLRLRRCARRAPARRSGHRPRAPRSGGARQSRRCGRGCCLRQRPMKAARSPIRAGSIASMRSRTRRATTGEVPPVPTATTTSPRSTIAGKMKVECVEVVHHIHGQADRLCPRRHRSSNVAGACAKDRDHAAEIGRQADRLRQARSAPRRRAQDRSEIMMAIGRDTSECARRPRPAGAISPAPDRRRRRAAQHRLCRSRNTGRNRIRCSLPQLPGLTGIIFYICLIQRAQRENYFFSIAVQL